MEITLKYGEDTICGKVEGCILLGSLDTSPTPSIPHLSETIHEVIRHPIGMEGPLFSDFEKGESVVILVSDSFRHTRVDKILPGVLEQLFQRGIVEDDIHFLFAGGTHRSPRVDEQKAILGLDVFEQYARRVHCHNPDDKNNLTLLGTTSRGTPVEINTLAANADRLILTGATVFHYFGGFGGGRKSIMPGIASTEAIAHNHSLNLMSDGCGLNPDVEIGKLGGNPVAEDMLEAAQIVGVDAMINTVLNGEGEIAGLFAGELEAAHGWAAEFARKLFAVEISERADLVIACAGDTKNFVQSHKALFNAHQAVKPEGHIVLLAQCKEGLGGEAFEKWIRLGDRKSILEALRHHSEINGQTALSTIEKAPMTVMVTDLSVEEVRLLGASKACGLDDAVRATIEELADSGVSAPTCYLMPNAAYTVPFIKSG